MRKFLTVVCISIPSFFSNAQQDTAVQMNTQLDNMYLCPGKQEVYLYIDLKGCARGARVPLNISVVFDRSGSMEGDRIHYGKMAIEYLIDQLQPDDIMSIVVYDHEAMVLHGSTPVTDKAALKRKLEHIRPRGATNLSAGLALGIEEVKSTYDRNKINRVFLLSDGHPNEGITDPYLLEKMVHGYAQKDDVTVSTFGLGHEFNEFIMHDIAEAGAGHYYYIQKPSDILNDFGREVSTLMTVAAQSAKLTITFPSEFFSMNKAYRHSYQLATNQIYIDLKEIHPAESTGILIKFLVKNPPVNTVTFQTHLTYYSSIQQAAFIIDKSNTISPNADGEDCKTHYDEKVMEQMIYYTSHYLMESAVRDVENNNITGAKNKLAQGKQLIARTPQAQGSPVLTNQYQIMSDYEASLLNWDLKSQYDKKHIQKKAHYHNYKIRKNGSI